MTLRNACSDYRDANGIAWDNAEPAEFSRATSQEQISCMNTFANIVGVPIEGEAILFELEEIDNVKGMIQCVSDLLSRSVFEGTLWCLRGTSRYSVRKSSWFNNGIQTSTKHSDVLNQILLCNFSSVSACTAHAAVEAHKYGSEAKYEEIFTFPHNATPSAGLIGTLGDNEAIDVAPHEQGPVPDTTARKWRDQYLGFICAMHTSHSGEAGRMRRVTADTSMRILSQRTIDTLNVLSSCVCDESPSGRLWLIFFMGKYAYADYRAVRDLCSHHAAASTAGPCAYSLYVQSELRIVVVTCSSGTMIKLTSNKFYSDSVEVHVSHRPFGYKNSVIDTEGSDSKRACFSAFASLMEYNEFDRAPRPSISSVQLPQAICLPWCVGTAAISPCYTFDPITTTPMYRAVMKDQKEGVANLASYMPGENVGVLYLNVQENYEDSILVSQKYIDNGGFSSISICTYLLSSSEYVPEVGHKMCGVLCVWWKSACHPGCKHTKEWISKRLVHASTRYTSGVVHEVSRTNQGEWSVKVRSFEQLKPGDKLSTKHGQKGVRVADVLGPEDLPMIVNDHGIQMIPDVVVAMSSIVTRQTNGQLFETAHSLQLLKDSSILPVVCEPGASYANFEDFNVLKASNGKPYTTLTTTNEGKQYKSLTMVTFGYVRMFSQTQKSRERHHVSHLSSGQGTLRTVTGRSRGGAVAYSEMDIQAAVAAGLRHCVKEITSRGSVIVVPICPVCQRLWLLCKRTSSCRPHVKTEIPYDQVVHTIVVKIVYGIDILYDVEVAR